MTLNSGVSCVNIPRLAWATCVRTKDDQYYDDAFYQLGMLYYENGDLENAKKTFYGMKSEVPDSMYNNSKVKEILSK